MANSITRKLLGANDGCMLLPTGVVLTGTLDVPLDLEVRGRLDGEARAQRITVAKGAEVLGDLVAHSVVVHGRVAEGAIFADKVVLEEGCAVDSEIYYAEIDIRQGALFEGKTRKHEAPTALAERTDDRQTA